MSDEPSDNCEKFCKLFSQAKLRQAYHDENCRLKKCNSALFADRVSCICVEGVEFMDQHEMLEAIRREWLFYLEGNKS